MRSAAEAEAQETGVFQCARCGGVFEQAWTREEALAELEENFPGLSPERCAVICDGCYEEFQEWRRR